MLKFTALLWLLLRKEAEKEGSSLLSLIQTRKSRPSRRKQFHLLSCRRMFLSRAPVCLQQTSGKGMLAKFDSPIVLPTLYHSSASSLSYMMNEKTVTLHIQIGCSHESAAAAASVRVRLFSPSCGGGKSRLREGGRKSRLQARDGQRLIDRLSNFCKIYRLPNQRHEDRNESSSWWLWLRLDWQPILPAGLRLPRKCTQVIFACRQKSEIVLSPLRWPRKWGERS